MLAQTQALQFFIPTILLMEYKKLFVVGHPRSGTTWLNSMLVKHPDVIAVRSESHAYRLIYEPFTYISGLSLSRRFKRMPYIARHYGIKALCLGTTSTDIWNSILRSYRIYERQGVVGLHKLIGYAELKALIEQVLAGPEDDLIKAQTLISRVFDTCFENCGGQPHQTFLEKTPFHLKFVDLILKAFPEAKVINILRDGRDVCASLQARSKTQKWSRYQTPVVISQWEKCVRLGEKYCTDPAFQDRFYSLKYEDLRQNTIQEMGKMYDFAELAYTSQTVTSIVEAQNIDRVKVKGAGQHINKGEIGNWQQALSSADVELWQERAGATLTKLGYGGLS